MTLYVGASAPVASDFIVSSRYGETDALSGLPVVAPDLTTVSAASSSLACSVSTGATVASASAQQTSALACSVDVATSLASLATWQADATLVGVAVSAALATETAGQASAGTCEVGVTATIGTVASSQASVLDALAYDVALGWSGSARCEVGPTLARDLDGCRPSRPRSS